MHSARTNKARTDREKTNPNSSDADVIFIADYARRVPAKEGARLAGMTPKGFQKLQLGENAISYKRLTQWMRNDPALAAAFAEHVGLLLPGQAEMAAAYTRFANAAVRNKP